MTLKLIEKLPEIHICISDSYIKLDAQVVHCYFDTPRHWISLSNSIKHYVYRGLQLEKEFKSNINYTMSSPYNIVLYILQYMQGMFWRDRKY